MNLSSSFSNAKVSCYWVPSECNLANALTGVSTDLVKLAHGAKYGRGQLKEELNYLDEEQKFRLRNTYLQVQQGIEDYTDLRVDTLKTTRIEYKIWKRGQVKKRLLKELMVQREKLRGPTNEWHTFSNMHNLSWCPSRVPLGTRTGHRNLSSGR